TRGRHVLAHVIGPNRQLPVPPVDQRGELHGPGTTVIAQRVQRGSDRAPGEQYVVDQDHRDGVDPAARQRRLRQWFRGPTPQVVTMQRDIERPGSDLGTGELRYPLCQSVREWCATCRDAQQHRGLRVRSHLGLLDDLMSHSGNGARDIIRGQQLVFACRPCRVTLTWRHCVYSLSASLDGYLKDVYSNRVRQNRITTVIPPFGRGHSFVWMANNTPLDLVTTISNHYSECSTRKTHGGAQRQPPWVKERRSTTWVITRRRSERSSVASVSSRACPCMAWSRSRRAAGKPSSSAPTNAATARSPYRNWRSSPTSTAFRWSNCCPRVGYRPAPNPPRKSSSISSDCRNCPRKRWGHSPVTRQPSRVSAATTTGRSSRSGPRTYARWRSSTTCLLASSLSSSSIGLSSRRRPVPPRRTDQNSWLRSERSERNHTG